MLSTPTAPPPLPPRLSHHHRRPQLQPQLQPQPQSDTQRPTTHQFHPSSPEIDEPPPAYTPSADHTTTVLELGPQYPFGPTHSSSSDPAERHHQPYHSYQPIPNSFPQAQPQPSHQQQQQQQQPQQLQHHPYYQQQQQEEQQQQHPHQHSTASQNSIPGFNEPSSLPTPGRPLLYDDRILVYPYLSNGVAYFCPKCCNTGFKSFDPNRPCRKCWLKYGRPWNVVRVSPMMTNTNTNGINLGNLQRPLPPMGMNFNQQVPLVVRPGDPRIGGRLCLNCNGKGSKAEDLNLFTVFLGSSPSEVCPSCRGTGRIFL